MLPPPAGDNYVFFSSIFLKLTIEILPSTNQGVFVVARWRGGRISEKLEWSIGGQKPKHLYLHSILSCRAANRRVYKFAETKARHLRLVDLWDVSPGYT